MGCGASTETAAAAPATAPAKAKAPAPAPAPAAKAPAPAPAPAAKAAAAPAPAPAAKAAAAPAPAPVAKAAAAPSTPSAAAGDAPKWLPEYKPESVVPPLVPGVIDIQRSTHVSLAMIRQDQPMVRKTKIVCTLGPKCWDEESLKGLLDAGMGIARFNFSHGAHEAHQEVLDRYRKVLAETGSSAAALLDTKGPEIRTAMLRDGADIYLEAGQEITVFAAGDEYTTFEGYKDDTGTVIGCSYAKLAQSVHPGNRMLFADGKIVIEVVEIIDEKNVKGKVLNDSKLGQRKNGNLPGIKVDIPVLTEKDVDDVQNFCAKNQMDYIAVSFVQTGDDVQLVRKTLDTAPTPGTNTQIICKIENEEGMINFDDILKYTDGIMVARGDLGMEIPSEKVPLAQKLLITKSNIAGKFVICATQMLESMCDNPLPTRAEMTDIANAVFDGADATMLSGETANGAFPVKAVATMAAIAMNAELGVDYDTQYQFLRYQIAGPGSTSTSSAHEALLSSVARMTVDYSQDEDGDGVIDAKEGAIVVVLSESGVAANLVTKYRPACPVFVVSTSDEVLRHTNAHFGQYPVKVAALDSVDAAVEAATSLALAKGMAEQGKSMLVVHGISTVSADADATVQTRYVGGTKRETAAFAPKYSDPALLNYTASMRAIRCEMDTVIKPISGLNQTKIICTLGPKCWNEENLKGLLDGGMTIARFNFSHGAHEAHQEVLDRYRKVCAEYGAQIKEEKNLPTVPKWACLLDTKGPEIRTAMLRDHQRIEIEAGQELILYAAGDEYTTFEGYKDDTGTVIGCSYAKLAQSVHPGSKILFSDGTISLEVLEIVDDKNVKCKALNTKKLGERKNGNLPGIKVDIPVLTEKDVDDVQNFCAKNQMDYIAVSFVQTGDDVQLVRKTLDTAPTPGTNTQIICKIENEEGMINFDDILEHTDGIMVARGDLGMEIPSEKVPLAQKLMITKSNIAGKFVICATQMLESMIENPLPTRAEMTDVANAVFDGADATMLSGETANGAFPAKAVATMAAIAMNAEHYVDNYRLFNFISNFAPKPISYIEAEVSGAVKSSIDMDAKALGVIANTLEVPQLIAKYRPKAPVIVITTSESVAAHCNGYRGLRALLLTETVSDLDAALGMVTQYCKAMNIADFEPGDDDSDQVVMVYSNSLKGIVLDDTSLGEIAYHSAIVGDEAANLYKPTSYDGDKVLSFRSVKIGIEDVLKRDTIPKKTKILCTLGPKCWDEESLKGLLDAGMNIARFNFSHGAHEAHQEVLDRYRKVLAETGSTASTLLDTKGPEIRTAMLRDGADIYLEAGQEITVFAAGDEYTTFEGYKDDTGTVIGCSYAKLAQSVHPGNRMLFADGKIVIEVVEIIDEKNVKGKVLNDSKLGQRKNGNLPGIKVDIPVLTEKDVDDVQNFCAKNQMDYIAVSFVQTGDDVQLVRKTLDTAPTPGTNTQIICKIENEEGMINFDDILKYTDGIMVARGDLGMEIPPEKTPLAQKLLITKSNIAGKFVICATQMLESMIENPLPTRAEMTDVANAVFDGADATMLSGETANGAFPVKAVATMAAIAMNAEASTNSFQTYDLIRDFTPKPMGTLEASVSGAVKASLDIGAGCLVVFTESGAACGVLSKYRPYVPIVVVTTSQAVVAKSNSRYAQYAQKVDSFPALGADADALITTVLATASAQGLYSSDAPAVVVTGIKELSADSIGRVRTVNTGGKSVISPAMSGSKTVSFRSTHISLEDVVHPIPKPRKTKILCTLGPKCWDEESLKGLLDAGMGIARFNFSHGAHEAHQEVLDRYRKVLAETGSSAAALLDTKGPEIRTAMLRDGADIYLEAGQEITVFAAGDEYTTFEGYKDDTGTVIGCSYAKLAQSVHPGNRMLFADGKIVIEVVEIIDEKNVKGKVLNDSKLGQRKNGNLPGIKVDIPVLTEKDVDDVQNFCAKNQMDYIAVSFVQTGDDVQLVRKTLDTAPTPGTNTQIICKIENEEGMINFDDILEHTDGIMVARGDLGMEIPSEKVPLAQKLLITKSNIAGKFVICATQMLESMIENPLPTRAEMTDIANAVFDGADATMLSGETANGAFPAKAVATMAAIAKNAEAANNYYTVNNFLRDFTGKPFSAIQSSNSCASSIALDSGATAIVVIAEDLVVVRALVKYRSNVPIVVVTSDAQLARHTNSLFGCYPCMVPSVAADVAQADLISAAKTVVQTKLDGKEGDTMILVHGDNVAGYEPKISAIA